MKSSPEATRFSVHNVSRRGVLLGLGSGGLLLAVGGMPALLHAQQAQTKQYGGEGMEHGLRDDPQLFIHVQPDGTVSVMCIRAEMGQGVRTSIAMVLADELGADWAHVRVQQAPGDEPRYGNQNTDGSRSLRQSFNALRRAGAAARHMLEQAAAQAWGVDVAQVKAGVHEVLHAASGRTLGFGSLATRAAALNVPAADTVTLKPPAQWRYIGKGKTHLIDGADIVTGRARFGIDTRLEGMLYAVVARPRGYGDTVASFDASAAQKMAGVVKVVQLDSAPLPSGFLPLGGIAVVADNTWHATQARQALQITWKPGPNADYDSVAYRARLEAACRQPGQPVRSQGDAASALARAGKRVNAQYYVPHLAHASMEPPAAVARVSGDRCEVWACVQAPQAAREQVAKALGLPIGNVTIHVTLLGGGFGRKSKPDFIVEAALLAREVGKPVKLTWTREDDIVNDYFHAVSVEHLEAGLDAKGKVSALLYRTAAPAIPSIFGPDPLYAPAGQVGQGITDLPFAIPNIRIEAAQAKAHTRIGWFRSVYNIPHAFALQSFVAELAHAAGQDHKQFLLDLLGPDRQFTPDALVPVTNYGEDPALYPPVDIARWRRVIQTVADQAQWGKTLPKGRGQGIAAHRSFASYTAVVCEVDVGADGALRIPRVDIAVDCGLQVNPERVRSQMEGSVIMGLSIALHSQISFKNGVAEQSNFHDFQVLRMNETPQVIHVHMIAADDIEVPLGGVGEPGVPPVAPALTNAIFAATGTRIRALPVADQLSAKASAAAA